MRKVSRVLEDHYIEARLHTDQGKAAEGNRALQNEMVESVANPYYIVIDPKSGQQVGGKVEGTTSEEPFLEFLTEAIDAAGRVSKLSEE